MTLNNFIAKIISFILALISAVAMLFGCGGDGGGEITTTASFETTTNEQLISNTTQPISTPSDTPSTTNIPGNSILKIIFIDVGQADSTLIQCNGKSMLIDGGNVADSSIIYTVLQKEKIEHLDYVIGTHAHEDHIGGLAGALSACSVDTVYCPVTEYDSTAFSNFSKSVASNNKIITVPKAGDSFNLGDAQVQILAPIGSYNECNDSSIVMKIVYGKTSFLFTGDAGYDSEKDILNAGYDLSATVLKVGHHGSSSSTGYVFLREIMPQYAVISVGEGNNYGHPTEAVLSRLRDARTIVYRTDMQGDITCVSNGKTVSFSISKNPGVNTNPTEPATTSNCTYIVNKKSGIIHRSTCAKLPAENNRLYYNILSDAYEAGYNDGCGYCKP